MTTTLRIIGTVIVIMLAFYVAYCGYLRIGAAERRARFKQQTEQRIDHVYKRYDLKKPLEVKVVE